MGPMVLYQFIYKDLRYQGTQDLHKFLTQMYLIPGRPIVLYELLVQRSLGLRGSIQFHMDSWYKNVQYWGTNNFVLVVSTAFSAKFIKGLIILYEFLKIIYRIL